MSLHAQKEYLINNSLVSYYLPHLTHKGSLFNEASPTQVESHPLP